MRTDLSDRTKAILFSAFLPFAFNGCTVITIENANSVETKFYPGLVMLQVVDAHNNVAINSRGFGTQLNSEGAMFGYFHEQRVYINDLSKCVTVFFDGQTEILKSHAFKFLTDQ